MKIHNREIGNGHPCFIVAEAGANFNGDLEQGNALIRAAAENGASAVKFQCYDLDLYSPYSAPDKRLEIAPYCIPFTWLPTWADLAHDCGLAFILSTFSEETTEIAAKNADALKIASCEANDIQLITKIAEQGLPVIASVGMTDWRERWRIMEICTRHRVDCALLACTAVYPCAVEDAPLYRLSELLEMKERAIGISDHTLNVSLPAVAVAMGAKIVEKHFTLDRNREGPDHGHSLNPAEFADMVRLVRDVEAAMIYVADGPAECEREAYLNRRSLHAARNIVVGQVMKRADIISQRPADGDAPNRLNEWVGHVATRDYQKGEPLRHD